MRCATHVGQGLSDRASEQVHRFLSMLTRLREAHDFELSDIGNADELALFIESSVPCLLFVVRPLTPSPGCPLFLLHHA